MEWINIGYEKLDLLNYFDTIEHQIGPLANSQINGHAYKFSI